MTMPPIDGEPPWLALYRAETERLQVLVNLFHDPDLESDSAFAKELFAIILDIAGRSAVKDFVPARLNRESVV